MRKTVEIVKCDLCGKVKKTGCHTVKYPVLFTSDQTEGRSCEPYISYENIDVCDECLSKIIKVTGYGAQGYNNYAIIQEEKKDE